MHASPWCGSVPAAALGVPPVLTGVPGGRKLAVMVFGPATAWIPASEPVQLVKVVIAVPPILPTNIAWFAPVKLAPVYPYCTAGTASYIARIVLLACKR